MQSTSLLRDLSALALAGCLALLTHGAVGQAPDPGAAGPSSSSAASTGDALPPPPPEDVVSEPARLSEIQGAVQLFDRKGKLFDQARPNMELDPGMRVETGNDGRAEIEFPDGSVARVTPNSALAFNALKAERSLTTPMTLTPSKGLTYFEFASDSSQIGVGIGKLSAVATHDAGQGDQRTLLRVSLDVMPYEAAVLRGGVHLQDMEGDASLDLTADQTATIDPASATNYDVSQEVKPDSWDTWNTDRDAALAELEGAGSRSSAGQPSTPGWNDLDYYGSWYNVPGQGLAWAPDGVSEDFDPYGSGAWGYYNNTGYSWTSSYPWGWLPYHCGSWNFYEGTGWMWAPNGCAWGGGGVWYPYTGVHTLPRGYRPPRRPLPPGGIHSPRVAQTVIAVRRGTPVRFRAVGEPRAPVRTLQFAGDQLSPLPVAPRAAYNTFANSGGGGLVGSVPVYRSSQANLGSRTIQPGYGRSSTISPPPRVISSAPRQVYTPPPAPTVHAASPAAPSGVRSH